MYKTTSEILADVLARLDALARIHGIGVTAEVVAQAATVSPSLVRKLMSGERTNPTTETLDRILAGVAAVEQQAAA